MTSLSCKALDWAWLNQVARNHAPALVAHWRQQPALDWTTLAEVDWNQLGLSAQTIQTLRDLPRAQAFKQTLHDWLMQGKNRYFIPYYSSDYPVLLKEIAHPPLGLYVIGEPSVLQKPQLAIVGSRKPSPLGEALAEEFAEQMSLQGYTITSGLALGIDGRAHLGALRAPGPTIAVIATGADCIYPRRHGDLAAKIGENGAIVSEFGLGTPPCPAHFPQRNRLISGLARGVLVVEATLKSGTLTTARHALEQNRDVFAIPGSVKNPMTAGCHALIQQGAKLVTSIDDILMEWHDSRLAVKKETGQNAIHCSQLTRVEQDILGLLTSETFNVNALIERLGLSAQEVTSKLVELTLRGLIQTVPGGYTRAWRGS